MFTLSGLFIPSDDPVLSEASNIDYQEFLCNRPHDRLELSPKEYYDTVSCILNSCENADEAIIYLANFFDSLPKREIIWADTTIHANRHESLGELIPGLADFLTKSIQEQLLNSRPIDFVSMTFDTANGLVKIIDQKIHLSRRAGKKQDSWRLVVWLNFDTLVGWSKDLSILDSDRCYVALRQGKIPRIYAKEYQGSSRLLPQTKIRAVFSIKNMTHYNKNTWYAFIGSLNENAPQPPLVFPNSAWCEPVTFFPCHLGQNAFSCEERPVAILPTEPCHDQDSPVPTIKDHRTPLLELLFKTRKSIRDINELRSKHRAEYSVWCLPKVIIQK